MSTNRFKFLAVLASLAIFLCFPYPVQAKSCIWQGAAGNWSDGSLWSCGAAPGPGDSAFIGSGTVTVDSPITVSDLVMMGGVLNGSADLEMDTFTWSGGTLGGSHTVMVKTQFTINDTGGHSLADQCLLTNYGALIWNTTDGLSMTSSSVFNNAVGAFFTIQTAGANLISGGAGAFNNAGTLTKAYGGNLVINSGTFANSGTVNLNGAGELTLFTSNLTNSPQSGAFNIQAGSTLRFYAGNYTFDTGSSISGPGNVEFYSWSITFNGTSTYNIYGTTSVTGGAVRFKNGMNLIGLGETLNISNGTLDLSSGAASPFMLNTFNLSGGVLTGADSLIVSTLNWSGGEMGGSGALTAATTLSANGSSAHTLSGSRVLNNNGTLTWNSSASLHLVGTPVFSNGIGAAFTVQSAGAYLVSGSTGTFNNYGTFEKATAGDLFINPAVIRNEGTINLTGTGRLILAASDQSDSPQSGAYNVPANSVLRFSSGSYSFNTDASISGTGKVDFGPAKVDFNAASLYNNTGTTIVSGAVHFNPGMTINSLGAALTVSGGTLDLSSGAGSPISVQSMVLSGGALIGTDALTVSTLDWSSGEMGGSGTTTVTGSISAAGGGSRTLSGEQELVNAGTFTWNSTANLYLVGAGTFTNANGATFTIQSAGSYLVFGGAGTFNNEGTLVKAAKGDLFINPGIFKNAGTVNLTGTGVVSLFTATVMPSAQTGTINVPTGAGLRFYGGSFDFNAGSSLAGAGSVEFYNAAVNFNNASTYNITLGTLISGGEVHFNPGSNVPALGSTLMVSGGKLDLSSGALSPVSVTGLTQSGGVLTGTDGLTAANFAWAGGDQSGSGTTTISKTITFTGTSVRSLKESRTLANAGVMTWDGAGYLTLDGTPVFDNQPGGLLNIVSSSAYLFSGGGGKINNAGTLRLPAGQIDVAAFYQTSSGVTEFAINGLTPVFLHTQIKAADVSLNGTAKINANYTFKMNDQFALISSTTRAGAFTTLVLPKVPAGCIWRGTYTPAGWNMTILAGYFMPVIAR